MLEPNTWIINHHAIVSDPHVYSSQPHPLLPTRPTRAALGMNEDRIFLSIPQILPIPSSLSFPDSYRTRQSSSPDTVTSDHLSTIPKLSKSHQKKKKRNRLFVCIPRSYPTNPRFSAFSRTIVPSTTTAAMKAIGYLIAGAALLTGASAQLLRSPAPNSSLGNGWRYKGCYSYVSSGPFITLGIADLSQRPHREPPQRSARSHRVFHPVDN